VQPATYPYQYMVCTGTCSNPILRHVFQIEVVLLDPCTNPTFTVPTVSDQEYTITAADTDYELSPKFSVEPAICGGTLSLVTHDTIVDSLTLDSATQTLTFAQVTDSLDKAGWNQGNIQVSY